MKIKILVFYIKTVLLVVMLTVSSINVQADIYKYVDDKGVVHLTNMPTSSKYSIVLKEKDVHEKERRFEETIKKLCSKYDVEIPLIKAVVRAESDFNPLAVSKKGAVGLMQLMPGKAEELKVSDPFDPYENLDGGIRHIRDLLDRFDGDINLVLAAYNAGENLVMRQKKIPPFKETRDYIKKVLQYKNTYQQ